MAVLRENRNHEEREESCIVSVQNSLYFYFISTGLTLDNISHLYALIKTNPESYSAQMNDAGFYLICKSHTITHVVG